MKGTMTRMTAVTGILLLFLCNAMTSFAASTITISSSGNGGFLLQGSGVENVAAMDITVTYDMASLANPRVAKGGLLAGAMMAVNANVPGAVRMGIITTLSIKGSGPIATLTFDLTGTSPGRIISLKASISNSSGSSLPVKTQIINPPEGSGKSSTIPTDTGRGSGTSPPPVPVPPGVGQPIATGVAEDEELPADTETEAELEEEPDTVPEETVSQATGTEPPAEPIADEKKSYTQKSVLDLFHQYAGKESIKAFVALFDQEPLIGFRQEPPIALADGKTTIKISFIAMPFGNGKPDITVNGAVVGPLKKDPDNTNTWIAELKPGKSAVSASLDVNQEKVTMKFPVTVAPRVNVDLDKSGAVTKADFALFLRDRGKSRKPRFDLNNDGTRDFVDNYIFTANYIMMELPEKKAPAVKGRP